MLGFTKMKFLWQIVFISELWQCYDKFIILLKGKICNTFDMCDDFSFFVSQDIKANANTFLPS